METVQLRHDPGQGWTSLSAIQVVPDYDVDATLYSDINDNLRKNVDIAHKVWHITFGSLTSTQQDFLIDMKNEEVPQMLYSSVLYDIRIKSISTRHIGSKITVANVAKES